MLGLPSEELALDLGDLDFLFKPGAESDVLLGLPSSLGGAESPTAVLAPALNPLESGAGSGLVSGSDGAGVGSATSSEGGAPQVVPDAAPGQAPASRAAPAGRRTLTTKNGKLLTEEQKERIRAKNRRAQSKYREKQKAKARETEEQYESVAAELERLRLENARLQDHNGLMERVLEVRETTVGVLEASKAEEAGEAAAAAASGESGKAQEAGAAHSACRQLIARGAIASGVAPPPDLNESTCPLSCGFTPEQMAAIRARPAEDVIAQYRAMVGRLAAVMRQAAAADGAAAPPTDAARATLHQQMVHALREGSMICFENAVANPTNLQRLMARSLDDGQLASSQADAQHWARVAASLELSREQLERLAPLRAHFAQRMGAVMQQRRDMMARLGGLLAERLPSSMHAMQGLTDYWLKAHQTNGEMRANLEEEHRVAMEFVACGFGLCLDVQQKARAVVNSWPHYPDMFSIASEALQAADMLPEEPPLLEGGGAGGGGAASG